MKYLMQFMAVVGAVISFCGVGAVEIPPSDNPYYGAYERAVYEYMHNTCWTTGDGFYTSPSDPAGFYLCQAGYVYRMECDRNSGYLFDINCICCTWPDQAVTGPITISCKTTPGCDCRDNPDIEKRGAGTCLCDSNGFGINYSGCSDTPRCPEIKDVDGNNRVAMKEPWPAGKCYAPKDITFSDTRGTFEFTDDCYYSE